MNLDYKQQEILRAGLNLAFGDYATLRQFLRENCNFDLNMHTDAGQGLKVAFGVAIDSARTNGWIDNLLAACRVHTNPELESVATIIQQQLARSRPIFYSKLLHNPFSALFLGEQECFIGRDGLRRALVEMQSGQSQRRVLVVNGTTNCGKTYSYKLLRLLDQLGNGNIVVRIDFREFREGDLESRYRDIVERINIRMGVPPEAMPQLNASETRWFQSAILKFENVARNQGKQLWLVFDHIGTGDIDDKITDALASTATYTLSDANALYVILIDVEPTRLKLAGHLLRQLRNDAATLPNRADLVAFLEQARAMSGKMQVSDAAIDQAVTGIMHDLSGCDQAERAYEFSRLAWYSAMQLGFLP